MAQYKVKASVEFQFNVDLDNQTEEIAEMIDRIRTGEYFPRDVDFCIGFQYQLLPVLFKDRHGIIIAVKADCAVRHIVCNDHVHIFGIQLFLGVFDHIVGFRGKPHQIGGMLALSQLH